MIPVLNHLRALRMSPLHDRGWSRECFTCLIRIREGRMFRPNTCIDDPYDDTFASIALAT